MSRPILVVDDEPSMTRILRLGLERGGYEVEMARSGIEALARLEEREFAAMVTDVCMPRMGGRELCEQIHERFAAREMVIFVASSRAESEYRNWTQHCGDIEFLEKPLSVRHLVARLSERLEAKKALESGNE